eukprot:m.199241 g.199241  ORF g.199241 m.199241 type:complete len:756 (+) comp14936_c0_seq1:144-2411(+)
MHIVVSLLCSIRCCSFGCALAVAVICLVDFSFMSHVKCIFIYLLFCTEPLTVMASRGISIAPLPKEPKWRFTRNALTTGYLREMPSDDDLREASSLPSNLQEVAVLQDILFVMVGVDGRFIQRDPQSVTGLQFRTDPSLDRTIVNVVKRILPLCRAYGVVAEFIDKNEPFAQGRVNQALASAMRTLLKDYYILVAQLESQFNKGVLSLQSLQFSIQPSLAVFRPLADIATAITENDFRGGQVLTVLHNATHEAVGQQKLRKLCAFLAEKASRPFLHMLAQWIHHGIIDDPAREFMVIDTESADGDSAPAGATAVADTDSYWRQRYVLRPEAIPSFLADAAERILETGKLLNVMRGCGKHNPYPDSKPIAYTTRARDYDGIVATPHRHATRELLQILMGDFQLVKRLHSIRNYFLLQQGDVFVHFADSAHSELSKQSHTLQPQRLLSLFELAQRTSSARADAFKDHVYCTMEATNVYSRLFRVLNVSAATASDFVSPETMDFTVSSAPEGGRVDTISGYDAFSLECDVPWPVSLVIDQTSIRKYQLVFRHLFRIKHIERLLSASAISSSEALRCERSFSWLRMAYHVRQQMLAFVQTLQHHLLFQVIEPLWAQMRTTLQSATTVDQLFVAHRTFLDTSLKQCMLTHPVLLKAGAKLLSLCEIFSQYMTKFIKTAELRLSTRARSRAGHTDAELQRSATKLSKSFRDQMQVLLSELVAVASRENEQTIGNLVMSLNFNGFYESHVQHAERAALPGRS